MIKKGGALPGATIQAIHEPSGTQYSIAVLPDGNSFGGRNDQFSNNNSVQLSIDLLNLGNFINSNWGIRQFPQNTQPIGVTVDQAGNPTYSFDANQTSTFVDDFSLASRWQMQLGLRL